MLTRRDFLRNALLAGAGTATLASLPLATWAARDERVRLTILHTNDMHSHVDPFPANDPKFPGLGGMGKRAALVKAIRAQEPNVLLLDAGDVFQGTPYFNFFGGELEFKLMSEMGYDACAIGNHDFDNGIAALGNMMQHANFPFVSANYDFLNTELDNKVLPHTILQRGPLKIGVFGLGVELEGLVDPKLYGETRYLEPIAVANQQAAFLKNEKGCNLVICLSHLGYEYGTPKVSDRVIAAESSNIDIVIGGHTHTLLNEPVKVANKIGAEVVIAQVGWAGTRVGRIDVEFEYHEGAPQVAQTLGKSYELWSSGEHALRA